MERPVSYVLPLEACASSPADRVGGKALGLGRLLGLGRDVPPGFVVTAGAYRDWVAGRALEPEIERLLGDAVDAASQQAASRAIQALFERAALTEALMAEVGAAYARLGGGIEAPVAVRSSATLEDHADASFAGQQDTYLGVTGLPSVARCIADCWASLFTPQAVSYRHRLGVPAGQAAMAVVVQRMVAAEVSGVMLTVDPVTGDRSQISIESAFGLGLPVVGGELTPDHFAVDKVTLEIRSRKVVPKPFADRLDPSSGAVRRDDLPAEEGAAPCLSDDEVLRLAAIGRQIERELGGPLDVEWALGPGPDGPRHLYLLQARPETVHSRKQADPIARPATTAVDRMVSMMLGGQRRRPEEPAQPDRPGSHP